MSPARPYVVYYRVSTKKQASSGLGLAAQRFAVKQWLDANGGRIVAEFTEAESGKLRDRPQLALAQAACRSRRGTLIVAKLDRLARNAAFLLSLRDAGVEFVACDVPSVNRLIVGVMAVVAEEEARLISERTKAALAAAKRRGTKLGTPENLTTEAQKKGRRVSLRVRQTAAKQRALDLMPTIEELRSEGSTTYRALAEGLNERGIPSARGDVWSGSSVYRMLSRC